ncbi:MAG: cell division protein FtsZ [Chitinophagaceae bacterium]
MIQFELPQNNANIIKVFGVGGGGSNAVNYMYNLGIEGVDFFVCNTDKKALANSAVPTKIQLGPSLTQGLGAGANPEIGERACEESIDEIRRILENDTKMVFITVGMGGGTGTGAGPIVAKVAKELGILTVGIVTTPFTYEGNKRRRQAEEGIKMMRQYVDTILVISNDKLRGLFGNLPASMAFCKADDILATATKCITDVINSQGHIVVDFADVSTVMKNGGVAILGSAIAKGEKRAYEAVEHAINSPLLNDDNIFGAKWILLNINSARGKHEHTLDEIEIIQAYVQEQAGEECDVIFGTGFDDNLEENISVTVIATGFQYNSTQDAYTSAIKKPKMESEKVVVTLQEEQQETTPELIVSTDAETGIETEEEKSMEPTIFEVEAPAIPNTLSMAFGLAKIKNTIQEVQKETAQESAQVEEKIIVELTPVIQEEQIETVESSTPIAEEAPKSLTVEEELAMQFGNNMKLVEKTEQQMQDEYVTIKGITLNRRRGSRLLTDMELEDQANFELQKRALSDRIAKLRSMSINVNKADQDIQDEGNIPAYIRQNQPLDEHPASNEKYYSNIHITGNGSENISTINTFLDGNKPD